MGRFNSGVALLAAASSLVLSTASVAAQTRVAPVRATSARAATPTQRDAQLNGSRFAGAPVWLLALLGALAVAGVIAAATGGGDNDQSPESP